MLNLFVILILGHFYESLAKYLTEWENHKTQTEFENSLTFKVFIFQFVNFYSSLFYIAFFKGNFVGYPGHYRTIFGMRQEECTNGCLIELTQQLAIITIGKQIINNCKEFLLPKIKSWLNKYLTTSGEIKKEPNQIEKDYFLTVHDGLFEEYLEMG